MTFFVFISGTLHLEPATFSSLELLAPDTLEAAGACEIVPFATVQPPPRT